MFKCGICNEQSKPGEKAFRVVIQTRAVRYPVILKAHTYKDHIGNEHTRDDPGGEGIETVKEVVAHLNCCEKFTTV